MLARIQRSIVAVLALITITWLILTWNCSPTVTWAGLLVIFLGHSVFLALEFAFVYWINWTDPAPHSGFLKLVRAWIGETFRAPRVFCWQQPFRSHVLPDQLEADEAFRHRRGVVFIHGFVCNRGFWNPWVSRIRQDGRIFIAVNLEPVFGSIDDYVPIIESAVQRVTAATGLPPLLICHSMGGLAARAWLRSCQSEERIYRVITLGTPHHGTWLSHFSHTINGRQMRLSSRWLEQLARDEPAQRSRLFTCYYSNCDNIVFPTSVAQLPGADNRFVEGVAHVAMAFDKTIMDESLALLD